MEALAPIPPMAKVARFLQKSGFKARDLAKESGINEGSLSRLLSGELDNPTYKTLQRIEKAVAALRNQKRASA